MHIPAPRMAILACCYVAAISTAQADPLPPADGIPNVVIAEKATTQGKGLLLFVSRLALSSKQASGNWSDLLLADPGKRWTPSAKPTVFCSSAGVSGAPGRDADDVPIALRGQLVECNNSRLLAGEGGTIRVVYVAEATDCNADMSLPMLEPVETERKTLLSLQVRQLLTHQFGGTRSLDARVCAWAWPDIQLTQKRAEVVVKTTDPEQAKNPVEFRVISGAAEHWFLSGDVLAKGASQLKYDFDTRAVTHKDKPTQIYLGINYMFGDVYGTLPGLDARRTVLKLIATPNKELNSVGVGLGYRLPSKFTFSTSKIDSVDHSGVVIFVARLWTKGEALDGTTVVDDNRRLASTRVGISYSIGTALGWLGPKK